MYLFMNVHLYSLGYESYWFNSLLGYGRWKKGDIERKGVMERWRDIGIEETFVGYIYGQFSRRNDTPLKYTRSFSFSSSLFIVVF